MDIKLLLLMSCAVVVNCQSTISRRNDVPGERELFEYMKSEKEFIHQTAVRSEMEMMQMKSEIESIRQTVAQQYYWSRNGCPPGFDYLPEVGSCFTLISEAVTWYNATERCREMMPGSHLAAITSQNKSDAIVRYLQLQSSIRNNHCTTSGWGDVGNVIWIGGQTRDPHRCGDTYVWKPLRGIEIPFNYTNWGINSPDCFEAAENCAQMVSGTNYKWNDENCDLFSCAICEL